jgi:hypothetical protein
MNHNHSIFQKLVWLFPFLYFIHDLEEILTIEHFLKTHSTQIPIRLTSEEFTVAFLLLWVTASFGCYQTSRNRPFLRMKPKMFFSFLVPGILLANGLAHIVQLLIFHSYVPGSITSFIIIFPYSFYALYFLVVKDQALTIKKFFIFLAIGFILQAPVALLAILIAKVIFYLI